jgi:subtilisin family serine protease
MKTKLLSLSVMFSGVLSAQDFYYAFNDSVHLTVVPNHFVVKFDDTTNASFIANQISGVPNTILDSTLESFALVRGLSNPAGLTQLIGVKSVNKYYINGTDDYWIDDKIWLRYNNGLTQQQEANIETTYGLTLVSSGARYRLYSVHKDSSALSVAKSIHELGNTVYCHPNFFVDFQQDGYIPNDEYFEYQFYLNSDNNTLYSDGNTGSIDADIDLPEAWELTFGSNTITTAIVDDGVAEFHDDLPPERHFRLVGSNLYKNSANATLGYGNDENNPVSRNGHGTAVAGIVAAEIDNGIGIAGVAPKTNIMPIGTGLFDSPLNSRALTSLIESFDFASVNGADVINCSWSISSNNPNYLPVMIDEITMATTTGRDGKGCIVSMSVGNNANHNIAQNGYARFPTNAGIVGLIAVGASDRTDLQSNYSPTDQNIDVVAPSNRAFCRGGVQGNYAEVFTTDVPGDVQGNSGSIPPAPAPTLEYNPFDASASLPCSGPPLPNAVWPSSGTNHLDYTGRFGGTSAAAPQVAGLAALVLSMNPCLTAAEVKQLIIDNADKINSGPNGYVYDANGHSLEVGYGRINAFQTLLAVRNDPVLGLGLVQTAPIANNVSINTPTDYASDIEIASGGVLTINSTLRMAQDRKIVIQPGGKLVMSPGSKITSISDCGNIAWQGIELGGNSSLSQTESNQGVIEINGTALNPVTIENAVDAISTQLTVGNGPCPSINWNSFGGIIKADYCRFENNLRDVQFMQCNHFESGIWQPNESYFNHCSFVKDRAFANPGVYRGAAVSMWHVQGVTFTACTFDNSTLTLEEQQVDNGIYGLNANFTVTWDCQNPNSTTGCTGADSSYFKGMEYGIRAEYTLGFSGPNTKVHGTEFKSTNGLYIGGSYNNIATRNSFYVEKLPAFVYPDIPYGLYLDYATNFTAQENEFYTRGTTGHNAGMVVNNHGSLYQLVYNNTFDNYLLGLSAQGENRSANNGETGLECRCNNFTLGEYDMFVYGNPNQPWNGIQREQGEYNSNNPNTADLAGNLFSLSGGLYSDYYNLPDYINYHHHNPNYGSNPPNVEPVDIFNVNLFPEDEDYQPCDPIIDPGKTSGAWQLELANAEQTMQADEALLEQLLNEEDNWQLEAEILFASQYGDWYDVYMDMMAQSPYLDHGIIESLILDANFPDLMLRNIMLANPDAAKAQHLLDLIYLRNMPAWMVADIEAGMSSYGAKEVLVGRIGHNKGVQHNAVALLLGIYGNSTAYNGLDSTITLLNTRTEVPFAYLLADAYLAKYQYTQAVALVNALPQNASFTAKDSLDYATYQNWYTLRAHLVETNQTWFDVDSTQMSTLQTLADTANKNAPMLWANHALKLIGVETDYREPVHLPNPVSQKTSTTQVISNGQQQQLVKVYPNPASDVLNLAANGVVEGQVVLFDLTGKLLLKAELDYGKALLNVKSLTPGVYLVRIYAEDNEELETVKVVVTDE